MQSYSDICDELHIDMIICPKYDTKYMNEKCYEHNNTKNDKMEIATQQRQQTF